jgi:hypothetical protein
LGRRPSSPGSNHTHSWTAACSGLHRSRCCALARRRKGSSGSTRRVSSQHPASSARRGSQPQGREASARYLAGKARRWHSVPAAFSGSHAADRDRNALVSAAWKVSSANRRVKDEGRGGHRGRASSDAQEFLRRDGTRSRHGSLCSSSSQTSHVLEGDAS